MSTQDALELPYVLQDEARFGERFDDRLTHVCAYELELAFGGPEEGGWWYDVGTPIASIPVTNFEEAKAAYVLLHERLADRYGRSTRHNVNGQPDLNICLDGQPARAFPEVRPHYE